MKKALLTALAALLIMAVNAQTPEDILRYSYYPQHGSARSIAIGGAMGSLGGDISATFVNPAGLGLYKTRELVLSPGLALNNNKAAYRGTNATANKSGFDLGTSGIVLGYKSDYSRWTSSAFSIGITQVANYNNFVSYRGQNNYSSLSEEFAEEFSNSGLTIDAAINNSAFAFGTAPALYSYLVDTVTINGVTQVKALPELLLQKGIALNQEKSIDTRGGIYELALGFASNMDDRFYIGGTLGIPIVSYDRYTHYRESDPSGDNNNNFNYFEYNDKLTTKGFGLNLKIGTIFKPSEFVRLGLAIHTPTYYTLTDRESSDMKTDLEGYANPVSVTSSTFIDGGIGETKYTALSPWRLIASGSYVFREASDVRAQKGFLTADIEYVGYPGSSFRADGETVTSDDQQYYDDLKKVIKSYYKSAMNFRLGGELKFNTIMVRAGGAYYGNPYEDSKLKSNLVQLSGGLGYRNHGVFIDLTYAHIMNKDVNFPYRLNDKENTFSQLKNTRGNLLLTVGFKI